MRRAIIATTAALGLALGMAGSANAAIVLDNWTFDFTGVDGLGATVVDNVQQIAFFGVAHAEVDDTNTNGLPDAGETFITDGHLSATQFIDNTGTLILPGVSRLGVDYELTFAFSLDGVFTSISAPDANFTHLGPQSASTGFLEIYVNNFDNVPPDAIASTATGNGYEDGEWIATFEVLAGEGGSYDFTIGDGSDDANFKLVSAKAGVFLDENGNDLAEFGELLIALTDSNFDGAPTNVPFGVAAPTNWGTYFPGRTGAGAPTSFYALEDGSARLGVVPEPGTMILLGSGLLGLAGYGRKRSKKS